MCDEACSENREIKFKFIIMYAPPAVPAYTSQLHHAQVKQEDDVCFWQRKGREQSRRGGVEPIAEASSLISQRVTHKKHFSHCFEL